MGVLAACLALVIVQEAAFMQVYLASLANGSVR
jgi:hypothetical protein